MIIRRIQITRLVLLSVSALLFGVLMMSDTRGLQHDPPTPNPCAADGVCRPSGPWGSNKTRWRPWPGDTLGQQPTSADEAQEREQLRLNPYELPTPEDESLRGPKKSKRKKSRSSDEAGEETPEPQPVEPLPGEDPFEGFDLQGDVGSSRQKTSPLAQPSREDIPPSLPSSLQGISRSSHRPSTNFSAQTAEQPLVFAGDMPGVIPAQKKPDTQAGETEPVPSEIVRTSATGTQGLRLVNPAASSVERLEREEFRQAYFEASDR